MRIGILGLVSGVAWLQVQAVLPARPWLLLLLGLLLAGACQWFGLRRLVWPLAAFAGILLGFGWAAHMAQATLASTLSSADEGRDIVIVGTIVNLPVRLEQGVRFNFAVEHSEGAQARLLPLLSLAWYSGFRDEVNPVPEVQPGERWRLKVRLQRPHGSAKKRIRLRSVAVGAGLACHRLRAPGRAKCPSR